MAARGHATLHLRLHFLGCILAGRALRVLREASGHALQLVHLGLGCFFFGLSESDGSGLLLLEVRAVVTELEGAPATNRLAAVAAALVEGEVLIGGERARGRAAGLLDDAGGGAVGQEIAGVRVRVGSEDVVGLIGPAVETVGAEADRAVSSGSLTNHGEIVVGRCVLLASAVVLLLFGNLFE